MPSAPPPSSTAGARRLTRVRDRVLRRHLVECLQDLVGGLVANQRAQFRPEPTFAEQPPLLPEPVHILADHRRAHLRME